MVERVAYDEFSYFHENAAEYGLPFDGPPVVSRERVEVEVGRALSALRWGSGDPELVLLHGGAQNAHTWDTVALALDRPLLAIDLPGHGHSDGAGEHPGGQLDASTNARCRRRDRAAGSRRTSRGGHVARRADHDRTDRRRARRSCGVSCSSTSRPAWTARRRSTSPRS